MTKPRLAVSGEEMMKKSSFIAQFLEGCVIERIDCEWAPTNYGHSMRICSEFVAIFRPFSLD